MFGEIQTRTEHKHCGQKSQHSALWGRRLSGGAGKQRGLRLQVFLALLGARHLGL